ncbi:MAG: aminomethyl transferase family protein [Deltaproteobacteria bacterium]|nr:aminomethyl transferase family protein [Deltaproteobacteria bacterium]
MPIGTPFHSRTSALCTSQNWRTWSGYFAASCYDVVHDYEYHAIRNTAGLIDISPLFKYDVRGTDAVKLVNRIITRDAAKCAVGQAIYGCLCDGEGKVIQDGTVFRLGDDHFRFHLADPALRWLKLNSVGMTVSIEEISEQIAALALQGPNALKILREIVDADLGKLKFFRLTAADLAGVPVTVSRTGYTGDLGYEIWLPAAGAEHVWDVLFDKGKPYGLKPAGMLALDVARLEAGFILLEVDYVGAEKALIPSQKYSPFEIGLSWTVDLKKDFFVGCKELRDHGEKSVPRRIVGLEVDWRHYEELYRRVGLPPHVPAVAWRGGVPLYHDDLQVGQATTGAWSPTLKKYIALATVKSEHANAGTTLEMETTVEYERKKVKVLTAKPPFFDPPRKRMLF